MNTFYTASMLANLLRYRWGRRRLVERIARRFTTRRRAARIAHRIP
jgi:hypothetical protein